MPVAVGGRGRTVTGTGPRRPIRRRRVPVPDRRTATSHRVGRDLHRLRSSPSRQRHLGWVSPYWWSWFCSWPHRRTRHRSPHPRLCRQPRFWSTIAARVVAWVTYKRSGKPADPDGSNANAFPFWTVHDPNASEPHLPVPSPPAPAGTGPSLTAQGIGGAWPTAAHRHDRINPADPHIGQSFLAYISGHRFSFLPSSLSPSWLHLLRLDTIPHVESERARWLRQAVANWGGDGRFRPTARYSAATTACAIAQPIGNRGGIPGYRSHPRLPAPVP